MSLKTAPNPTPSAIVIIGSGLAGYTLIREIRKLDKEAPITLVTREPGYLYSNPTTINKIGLHCYRLYNGSTKKEDNRGDWAWV